MNSSAMNRRALLKGAGTAAAVAAVSAGATWSSMGSAQAATSASTLRVQQVLHRSPRLVQVNFDTPEIGYKPWASIMLPPSYWTQPSRRFPVLFLLHGGGQNYKTFLEEEDIANLIGDTEVIVVMPDGGAAGWYCNPISNNNSARNYENFHIKQLVPWIDANLRTFGDAAGRGVCGFSMGGFGALKYVAKYPQLFSTMSAHSGPPSLRRDGNIAITWANLTSMVELNGAMVYGAFWNQKAITADNAMENLESYRGKRIFMVAGTDINDASPSRGQLEFSAALTKAGIANTAYQDPGGHIFRHDRFTEDLAGIMRTLRTA